MAKVNKICKKFNKLRVLPISYSLISSSKAHACCRRAWQALPTRTAYLSSLRLLLEKPFLLLPFVCRYCHTRRWGEMGFPDIKGLCTRRPRGEDGWPNARLTCRVREFRFNFTTFNGRLHAEVSCQQVAPLSLTQQKLLIISLFSFVHTILISV